MKRFSGILLIFMAVLMLALTGTALAANVTQLSIAQIRQDAGDLYVYLTGVNDRGKAALDTGSVSEYALELDGNKIEINDVKSFLSLNEAVHYIICVDVSKSIKEQERKCIREALEELNAELKNNERITLFTFGNESKRLMSKPGKKNDEALTKAIADLKFDGDYTALYQVIDESTDYSWESNKDGQFARTAVLIVTDGTDDPTGGAQGYTFENIREDVRLRNVPVYIATFYRGDKDKGKESVSQLQELAAISGGFAISLTKDDDAHEITKKLTNILGITRQSTRLCARMNSGMEHGNDEFTVIKNNNGRNLATLSHYFEVNWNIVPEPTPLPDTTLTKLEVGSVNEDSTFIHVVTEPGATVYVQYDDNRHKGEGIADKNGQFDFLLSEWISDSFSIEEGHKIIVSARDAQGNSALGDGKEGRAEIKVEASNRKQIEVNIDNIDQEGVVYGESLTVRGTAQGNTQVVVMWVPDAGDPVISDPVNTRGTAYYYSFPADAATLGTGSVVVKYADNTAAGKQGSYKGVVNWIRQKTEQKEARLDVKKLFEDSETIYVTTEPNTRVTVENLTTDQEIDSHTADESGIYTCSILELEEDYRPSQGDEIRVSIVDGSGAEKYVDFQVGEAKRKQITVRLSDVKDGNLVESETLTVAGNAEAGEELLVRWLSDDAVAGAEEQTVTASINGWYETVLNRDGFTEGYGTIEVSYKDGLAKSKAGSYEGGRLKWIQTVPTVMPSPTIEPTPTPAPMPSATATVVPKAKPTSLPTPTPVPSLLQRFENNFGGRDKMLRDWRFWAIIVAGLLLIALIVLLIVFLARKAGKNRRITSFDSGDDAHREGALAEAGTIRRNAPRSGTGTSRMGKPGFNADSSGTANMGTGTGTLGAGFPGQGTGSLDEGTGTVRIHDGDDEGSGTVRLSDLAGPRPMLVHIHESRDWEGVNEDVTLSIKDEITIGRAGDNDMTIHDKTVSGHHLKLIYRDQCLFAQDLMSSNGTTVNGQRISAETMLSSGDKLVLGQTTLIISFGDL